TDQDDFAVLAAVLRHFEMHFGYQRTGGVKDGEIAPFRFLAYRQRDAVGAENHRGAVRHFVQFVDKNRAFFPQTVDDVTVVHHLVTYVNRRAEQFQSAFDDFDGPVNTGAKTAGTGESNLRGHGMALYTPDLVQPKSDRSP